MYKLVLGNRTKAGIDYSRFHDHWLRVRSALVLQLQSAMGYDTYEQTHASSRLNPLYLSLLFSRSRLITSLLSSDHLPPNSPPDYEERWDVTDEFGFASADALAQAFLSEAGAATARRLIEDQAPWVRRTAVVTAEKFIDAPDPAPAPVETRTTFFLRRRPDLIREQMLSYWGTTHKQLVLSLQADLKYRAYNQLHVRSTPDFGAVAQCLEATPCDEFDGVAELCFTSQWVVLGGIFNPRTEVANLKLVKNELNFMNEQRSDLVFGNHYRFPVK